MSRTLSASLPRQHIRVRRRHAVTLPPPDRDAFFEALLKVMDGKTHWAWSRFMSGEVAAQRLHRHFEQEWDVYVRDFPVLLGRSHAQCPIPEARRDLAEFLYEEETGALCAGRPHPELFLELPRGLGMDLRRFDEVQRGLAAQTYRDLLDECTTIRGWSVAAAVTTLFIPGHAYQRHSFDPSHPPRPEPVLDAHPLVVHYGLPVESLTLVEVRRQIEGRQRMVAWRMLIDHTPEGERLAVVESMHQVCNAWRMYRDEVAYACGLTRR